MKIRPTHNEMSPSMVGCSKGSRMESGANIRKPEDRKKANTTCLSSILSAIRRNIFSYQEGMPDKSRGTMEYSVIACVCSGLSIFLHIVWPSYLLIPLIALNAYLRRGRRSSQWGRGTQVIRLLFSSRRKRVIALFHSNIHEINRVSQVNNRLSQNFS